MTRLLKKVKDGRKTWDKVGIFVSGLCVLHCLLVPVFLFFIPALSGGFLPSEDKTHAILLAFILGVAGLAFVTGFKVHGRMQPIVWMLIGIVIIVYATYFAHHQLGHLWEPVIAIIGSLFLIRAHQLNHVHCRTCEEHHVAHGHEDDSE